MAIRVARSSILVRHRLKMFSSPPCPNAHVVVEAAAVILAGDVVVGKAVRAGAPEVIVQVACVETRCH